MARMTEFEQYAISRKIVRLMREGFPQDQATAIAFRMWRDGELPLPPTPQQQRSSAKKRREEYRRKLRDRRK
jgi:hypothetical protein